ncbi:MAG: beta-lactamase family protein [Gemmatimonadota bacterium]|nr:MAG: beta-lactamase family protein [Gemmatimonadota bacterium]
MKNKLLFASIVLTFLVAMCFKATVPKKLPFSKELQDVLDSGLKKTGGTGVSAAVIVTGKGEWVGVGGMSDLKTAEAIKPNMLFDIASVGKTFIAALVLQLAEEDRLILDDPLQKWLPDFSNIDNTVTIRQLLNHTSGISHFTENTAYWKTVFGDLDSLWTPEDILAFVSESHFPPGGGWHYSSTNYVLLGMIIEKVTESTLTTQLRNRFFIPLKLNNTFTPLDIEETLSVEFAHAHFDLDGDGELDDMGYLPRKSIFSSVWAAGQVVSTAEDLVKWAEVLYSSRVLKKETLDQMIDFHRPTPGEPLYSGYGLGTGEFPGEFFAGDRAWGHLGWQPGYMTAMLYFPNHSVSLAVMINDNNEDCITYIAVDLWSIIKNHLEVTEQH